MADPARLTDQQIEEIEDRYQARLDNPHAAADFLKASLDDVPALLAALRADRTRLAAYENLRTVATGVAWADTSKQALRDALAALDRLDQEGKP